MALLSDTAGAAKIARIIIDAIQWMIANVRFGSTAVTCHPITPMTASRPELFSQAVYKNGNEVRNCARHVSFACEVVTEQHISRSECALVAIAG